jgi:hypothetical protein
LSNRPVCGKEGSEKDTMCRDAILKGIPQSKRSDLENHWQTAYTNANTAAGNFWSTVQEARVSKHTLASILRETVCAATGAPYVLRQMLHGDSMHFLRLDEVGEMKSVVRGGACPGGKALTSSDLTRFDRWSPDERATRLISLQPRLTCP